jgi:uncharacterized glyoxalase superfamily protein PhnB
MVPMLAVADVGRSINFYTQTLGFQLIGLLENGGTPFWARFKAADDVELMVTTRDASDVRAEGEFRDVVLYFYPESVERVRAHLIDSGMVVGKTVVTFYGMNEIRITDPDGYELCFGENAQLQEA